MLNPRINSQTFWPKDISHDKNGTTFCVCSALAFSDLKAAPRSVLTTALKQSRSDRRKVITTKGLSPNRNQWEIWYREVVQGHQPYHLRWYFQARGNSDLKITKWGLKQTRVNSSFKIHKGTSLKVIQWRILKWGIGMQDRRPAQGRLWHGNRTESRILKQVRVRPSWKNGHWHRFGGERRMQYFFLSHHSHSRKEWLRDCE